MNSNYKDESITIKFFKEKVNKFVKERNWSKYHTPKNLIQALGIEIAELSELFLFKNHSIDDIHKDQGLLEQISDEISDIFIYLISVVNCFDIDLTNSFLNKMEKNRKKYPIEDFKDGTYYKK